MTSSWVLQIHDMNEKSRASLYEYSPHTLYAKWTPLITSPEQNFINTLHFYQRIITPSFIAEIWYKMSWKEEPVAGEIWHESTKMHAKHFDGLVQDCSISIANALEILQSCTKPSI